MGDLPTPAPGDEAGRLAPEPSPAAAPCTLATLKRRAEFLACARGRNAHTPGMVVQGRARPDNSPEIRVGFTTSRKVGKAVARNRARRRLREVARRVLPQRGREGWDYVLIARAGNTVSRPFARLVADLERALDRLHGDRGR